MLKVTPPSLLQYHVPMDIQGMLQQQNVPQVEDITWRGATLERHAVMRMGLDLVV